MQASLLALQQRLQHVFSDPALLQRAVTHRSFSADHNERLEFLGDSVLNLAVSSLLYERLRTLPEGDLSRVRANLVKQDTLHQLALRLQLLDALSGKNGNFFERTIRIFFLDQSNMTEHFTCLLSYIMASLNNNSSMAWFYNFPVAA